MFERDRASELSHPFSVGAIFLLVVNDHLLKGAGWLPTAVTGKLSDLAGLFFFPILLLSIGRLTWRAFSDRHPPDSPIAIVSAVLTATGFAAVKLSPFFNAFAGRWWGHVVMDSTDLFCLPMCALAAGWLVRYWRRRRPLPLPERPKRRTYSGQDTRFGWRDKSRRRAVGQWAVLMLAVVACWASAYAPKPRNYPHWQIQQSLQAPVPDLQLAGWGVKSGKQGAGIMVRVTNPSDGPHRLRISGAHFRLFRQGSDEIHHTYQARPEPASVLVGPGGAAQVYLPFRFDGQAAWNEHRRRAHLLLDLRVDGRPAVHWRLPALYVRKSAHLPYLPSHPDLFPPKKQ